MSLSLCMIVKNEESKIEKCLKSVSGLVDEMIVVDTGSTDKTKSIAEQLGAKIFDYQWGHDFSAARNYSLEKATKDWIIVLDADEYLDANPKAVQEALSNPEIDAYALRWEHIHFPKTLLQNYKTRLFRRDASIRFKGMVHEDVVDTLKKERWKTLGATLVHDTRGTEPSKVDYYLELLEKELEKNSRTYFFLGLHNAQRNFQTHSRYYFLKAMETPSKPLFSILSGLQLVRISTTNPKEAFFLLDRCKELAARYPDDPELKKHPEIVPLLDELTEKLKDFSGAYQEIDRVLQGI